MTYERKYIRWLSAYFFTWNYMKDVYNDPDVKGISLHIDIQFTHLSQLNNNLRESLQIWRNTLLQ